MCRTTVGWTQRSALGSPRLHLPSSHFCSSCGHKRKIQTRTMVNSVILPTLLYGLESTVLLESFVRRLEFFVVHCLRITLGISVRQKKQISSILTQRHLRFLGHLSRMSEERLLVSAPVGSKCTVGGQKHRWSDLVVNDLKQCNLSRSWREQAQEHYSWRATIKHRVELLYKQAVDKEMSCKDEKKRRQQQRLIVSESALHCSHPGCFFQAQNQAGLSNHRQRHFTIQMIQCQYCHQTFHQQGLHNHQCFCQSRPPAT